MGLTLSRIAIASLAVTLGRVALNGLMMGSVFTVVMGAAARRWRY